ncbi:hypothetical protein [Ancylobacter sp. G4_0304]|uniref:hypothetical protein n=1 Tax=Ancylobacter sp. G4_0304 TaxID=3114289 RepID=UPI0039C6A800
MTALLRLRSVAMEDLFHGCPQLAIPPGAERVLAGDGQLPPFLIGQVGGNVAAVILDINCGAVLDGVPIEEKGRQIFRLALDIAAGRRSKPEMPGQDRNEFVPWQSVPWQSVPWQLGVVR